MPLTSPSSSVVLSLGHVAPEGSFDDVWKHFWLPQVPLASSELIRGAAKHATVHGTGLRITVI